MTALSAGDGDIVIVPFPFASLSTTKRRPALVVAEITAKRFDSLLLVAMITSQLQGEQLSGDYLVRDWEAAQLLHPSKIRCAKLVTVEKKLALHNLGRLTARDIAGAGKQLKDVLSDWL